MKNIRYKLVEFFIIFVLFPVSFVFSYPFWIKLVIGCIGLCYIIYVLLKIEKEKIRIIPNLNWNNFFKGTLLKLLVVICFSVVYMLIFNNTNLFHVVIKRPITWLKFICIYSFFSVYPQELVYRTFYFKRYEDLFKHKYTFIFVNAIVFSLAHLFFKNILVLLLTCIGGIFFALTYRKTRSTLLVSIEHAIYGSWLFTVGMGQMLGFPM